jgi:hypothetical protein
MLEQRDDNSLSKSVSSSPSPPLDLQVTFLPLLSEPCSFDLLVYTNKKATVPKKWEDSDPRYIMNSQEVKLRSFTTSVRKILIQCRSLCNCVTRSRRITSFVPFCQFTHRFTRLTRWSPTKRPTNGTFRLRFKMGAATKLLPSEIVHTNNLDHVDITTP